MDRPLLKIKPMRELQASCLPGDQSLVFIQHLGENIQERITEALANSSASCFPLTAGPSEPNSAKYQAALNRRDLLSEGPDVMAGEGWTPALLPLLKVKHQPSSQLKTIFLNEVEGKNHVHQERPGCHLLAGGKQPSNLLLASSSTSSQLSLDGGNRQPDILLDGGIQQADPVLAGGKGRDNKTVSRGIFFKKQKRMLPSGFAHATGNTEESWVCGDCGHQSPRKLGIHAHMRCHGAGKKIHVCHGCNMAFKHKDNYNRHQCGERSLSPCRPLRTTSSEDVGPTVTNIGGDLGRTLKATKGGSPPPSSACPYCRTEFWSEKKLRRHLYEAACTPHPHGDDDSSALPTKRIRLRLPTPAVLEPSCSPEKKTTAATATRNRTSCDSIASSTKVVSRKATVRKNMGRRRQPPQPSEKSTITQPRRCYVGLTKLSSAVLAVSPLVKPVDSFTATVGAATGIYPCCFCEGAVFGARVLIKFHYATTHFRHHFLRTYSTCPDSYSCSLCGKVYEHIKSFCDHIGFYHRKLEYLLPVDAWQTLGRLIFCCRAGFWFWWSNNFSVHLLDRQIFC